MSDATSYHVPVLVEEVMEILRPEAGGLFLDGTVGGGGHAEALLTRGPEARLIGVDRDPDAIAAASRRLERFGDRVRLVSAVYADAVAAAGIAPGSLQGALLDLGVSSHQVDEEARGFTFRAGAPLDMRMAAASRGEETAADLLARLSEEELANIFFRYGEERRARRLARTIVEMREREPLTRSEHLVEAIERSLIRPTAQDRARIFQALRIAVNKEIEGLERALPSLRDALASGGAFVVLSYHSLEDRLVKESFREWSRDCVCPPQLPVCVCGGKAMGKLITRKPIVASREEVERNPRARSVRLRAWRRA
ncbi:MAG TPA: 16S rRNA (cytosine(1402)-N(4))-methyltransferase RsmH [Longimicrobiaceae bacterium]